MQEIWQAAYTSFSLLKSSVSDPDPHKEMPPGSGSAWTDADPDPGGKKA